MSPVLISLMFAAGSSTWIYTKFQRISGNNTRQSVIASAICFVLIFGLFYYISSLIINK